MVFTHCGRLGDFFCCLPVLSWWHKQNPDKEIHIVLAGNIEFVASAIELCRIIPFITSVQTCGHKVSDECGGQPYQFNPNDYGYICDEYVNIGFRDIPDKFVPQYFAEEHGFDVDLDFKIDLPPISFTDIDYDNMFHDKTSYSLGGFNKKNEYKFKDQLQDYYCFNPEDSIIKNLQIAKSSKKIYTAPHGFSIALNLCKIDNVVFLKHNPFAVNYYLPYHGTLLNMTDDIWFI